MRTWKKIVLTAIWPAALSIGQEGESLSEAIPEPPPRSLAPTDCLPLPLSTGHFTAVKTQSPFLRELNLSETYAIRALATIGDTKVATLYNRQTKKTHMVFPDQVNDRGMQLVEVIEAENPLAAAAKVSFAGEVFEVKYDQAQTKVRSSSGQGSGHRPSQSHGSGERRGPSKEDMERYKSLSEEQRNKFREYIRHTMQKYPNLSREERGNMIRGAMTKLADGRELNVEPVQGQSSQPRQSQQNPGQPRVLIRTTDGMTTIRTPAGGGGGGGVDARSIQIRRSSDGR